LTVLIDLFGANPISKIDNTRKEKMSDLLRKNKKVRKHEGLLSEGLLNNYPPSFFWDSTILFIKLFYIFLNI